MAKTSKAKILKATDKDFSPKSEKLITFLELYVEYDGDNKKAWADAGYTSNVKGSMSKIRENWRLVKKLMDDKIGSHVPMALAGIVNIAENAKNDSVKLKALQDLLSRAGYDKPIEIVTQDKDAHELDNKSLDEELTKLIKRQNDAAALH